ncbi:YaiO family outer membrane beta-barrel protein [bacterium]|nr:YaiO family outer membrane beta-barrel protein [bacterium]
MNLKQIHIILVIGVLGVFAQAQELAYVGDPDVSFFTARNLAFDGQRSEARDTLQKVLAKYPDYSDVRNLLASTYSWDGEYELARAHFNKITSVEHTNKEAWVASIKNELYAEYYYLALGLSNKALGYLPNDPEVLALNIRATENINLQNRNEQKTDVNSNILKDSIESMPFINQIGITNSFDLFDKVYDPAINTSVEYKRETQAGPFVPRINYANRFNTNGIQFEVDFYPKFSKLFYGYLNYGYSNSPIFPDHRVGAELYSNWPKSMELSLGMRYLDFAETKANIITGSVGLYKGNYYLSLRPYITPTDSKTGLSGTLLARKYLKDGENYLGLNLGMGFAPELTQLSSGNTILAETLLFIESQQVLMEYQFTGKKNPNIYRTNLGITRQELIFDSGNFFLAISAGLTYQVKF